MALALALPPLQAVGRAAEIVDRGAYLRVQAPGKLILNRAAAEEALGRPFALPKDLEPLMPAFKGRLTINEDAAVWEASAE